MLEAGSNLAQLVVRLLEHPNRRGVARDLLSGRPDGGGVAIDAPCRSDDETEEHGNDHDADNRGDHGNPPQSQIRHAASSGEFACVSNDILESRPWKGRAKAVRSTILD